jgi:Flp pilus assembly protein TadD
MILRRRGAAALVACALAAGCAGGVPADQDMAKQVDPSLRAAALTAEAGNDYKGAAQHWRTLLEHHPDDKVIAVSLARALRFSGQAQQGADLMQMMAARVGRDADLLAEMGKDYLAAERMGLALKSLDEARRLDPLRWDVPDAMGICHDIQGQPAEAAAAYAEALKLSPDNPEVLNNLAMSQALAGKLDEAIATLHHAYDQPAAGAQVRQNLALLTALKGDSADAARLAALDLPPAAARANAEIYRQIAKGVRQ